ncbi:protein THEMIS2 isoform X1 [Struthio camelus]|uniref:protein THEMIS2 isoform X1 n=1 Tax=Struthio camelus TaxID=8801 RepID=UPI003603F555
MEPLSFQEYICSLKPTVLPRILRICSGVYFQGSVYEISGNECCLSTGDFLKIIAIKLQNVIYEDVESGQKTELPLTFKGLFQPSPDPRPYASLEELIQSNRKAQEAQPLCFISTTDLAVDGQVVPKAQPIFLEALQGRKAVVRMAGSHGELHSLRLPLSLRGRFFKSGGQRGITLQEVLGLQGSWPQCLLCPALSSCPILLIPVYEVQAIMHLRKDVVKIPSTLEVDVEDVTEEAQDVHFIKPLLLSEVLQMEDALPVRAEILEGPSSLAIFENNWIPHLQKGQQIQIHGKGSAWKVLASARKGTRHFLLSSTYQGRFRRRPREFTTVYELATSLQAGQCLRVVVTQDCEGQEEDVPSLSVGDRLEVQRLLQASTSTVLLCNRSSSEEEETEELILPLNLGGSFVEEICDSKKYSLTEILEQLPLPCDVKVVAKDPSLTRDVLSSFSALRLEAHITEPFLVSSFCEDPDKSFEIPPRWMDMSLFFIKEPVHPQAPSTDWSRVEELKRPFYYHLLKQLPGSSATPPPRPPKRKEVVAKAGLRTAKGTGPEKAKPPSGPKSPLPQKARSPFIMQSIPNEYSMHLHLQKASLSSKAPKDKREAITVMCSQHSSSPFKPQQKSSQPTAGVENSDSDHDYEIVDEALQKTICKMQTIFPF